MMAPPLTAGDLCTREVCVALRTTPLDEAARLMRQYHVGTLVVVDETGRGRVVVGILTDRDIVTAVVARGVAPETLRAEDVMSADPLVAREAEPVTDLLAAMRRKGVRRVPVVDAGGVLVGLVSLDDVLEVIADALRLVVQAMDSGRRREPVERP